MFSDQKTIEREKSKLKSRHYIHNKKGKPLRDMQRGIFSAFVPVDALTIGRFKRRTPNYFFHKYSVRRLIERRFIEPDAY